MRQTLEWVICYIDDDTLIRVIRNEEDILYAYQVAEKLIQVKFDGENESSILVNYDNFEYALLPNKDVFLKLEIPNWNFK